MNFKHVEYKDLQPKQQEIYNFQKLSGILADYGFNCIKLSDDWNGADFLAYHHNGEDTIKVQLKGRLSIFKKYIKKDIYIAFPINNDWYLIEHDELVKIVENNTPWLESESWITGGGYASGNPSQKLLDAIKDKKYLLSKTNQLTGEPISKSYLQHYTKSVR